VSANFERLLIANELIGRDRFFDPPESFEELQAMLDGNRANDATGDPISGPDGIFFANYDGDGDGVADRKAVRVATFGLPQVADIVTNIGACGGTRFCYQRLGTDADGTLLVHAMPIGIPGFRQNASGGWDPFLIDVDRLGRIDVQRLVDTSRSAADCPPQAAGNCSIVPVDSDGDEQIDSVLSVAASRIDGRLILRSPADVTDAHNDPDADQVNDLDEDRDGVFDFVDDWTRGPVSDDSVLCGSGVPGDLFQDALQTEYANASDRQLEIAAYDGKGLPPRSPVFCRSTTFLIGLTGESAPGRHDFLWHGGATPGDLDEDGVNDHADACLVGDDAQDADADGLPDACDACRGAGFDDADADGVCASEDSCPTIADASGADRDGDGVGDACDNCVDVANPRVVAAGAQTTTGGQPDGDGDGFGNACDAAFERSGPVSSADLAAFKRALGRAAGASTCGPDGDAPCERFDLDGSGTIDSNDLPRFRTLFGRRPGPRCAACGVDLVALPCEGPGCVR
jgi:hypothetical protein